jgi:UDP:flavonoid glycosyltransferase YjiC (YdhE family)
MAQILASTTPARGHLFPLVPVLDELGRRGHHIALRTLAAEVPSMQARGFDAAPISARIGAITHDDWRASNPRAVLARGVPVCAVPFGRDQLEVARRVVVAGAGTRLAARRLRPDRLRAKVHEAISLREGARRIQQAFAAAGGPPAAADAVETRLLERERPRQRPSRPDQAAATGS